MKLLTNYDLVLTALTYYKDTHTHTRTLEHIHIYSYFNLFVIFINILCIFLSVLLLC